MTTDLSFITNEKNQSLKDRFEVLIKDTSFFDALQDISLPVDFIQAGLIDNLELNMLV